MLEGKWAHHLEAALRKHVSAQRRVAWGIPEGGGCPFSSVSEQIGGVLYDKPPSVGGAADAFADELEAAALWPLMQDYSVNLIGMREMAMRIDWSQDLEALVFRPVLPFDLVVKGHRHRRDMPVGFAELQLLEPLEGGKPEWVWEHIDVSRPDMPIHMFQQVSKEHGVQDVTRRFSREELSGEAYRYRWTTGKRRGRPFLPLTLHHAKRQAKTWDAFRGSEVVFGSLTVGVLQTMLIHVFRDCSFPTTHAVGLSPRGVKVIGQGKEAKVQSLEADPGSINLWDVSSTLQPGQSPMLQQLEPGGDIEKMSMVLEEIRTQISEFAGVSPGSVQKRSGDPRSGYAISISQAGLRAAQGKIEPQLRTGDLDMLHKSAAMLNIEVGGDHPETGMSIVYPAVPKSPEEIAAQREDESHRLDNGLASPVDIYLERNPGVTREQAIVELARIRSERNLIDARAALR